MQSHKHCDSRPGTANGIKQKFRHSGFSLVEILIIIVVIGILSTIGIPAYLRQLRLTKENAARSAAYAAARACAAHIGSGSSGNFTQANIAILGGTCNSSNTAELVFQFTNDSATSNITMRANGSIESPR